MSLYIVHSLCGPPCRALKIARHVVAEENTVEKSQVWISFALLCKVSHQSMFYIQARPNNGSQGSTSTIGATEATSVLDNAGLPNARKIVQIRMRKEPCLLAENPLGCIPSPSIRV